VRPPAAGASAPASPARGWPALAAAAAALFLALALRAAWLETPTVDEFAHVPAGVAYLERGAFGLYAKNPPLFKMIAAAPLVAAGAVTPPLPGDLGAGWAPWEHGARFLAANRGRYLHLFFLARLASIGAALLTGLLLHRWARSLFGAAPAAIVTAAFFLDPTVLAHGHLATVDAGAMLAIVLALLALRRAGAAPSPTRLALAGAAWGAALAVKFTALLLAPVVLVLVVAGRPGRRRAAAADLAVLAAAAVLTVNLAFGFAGSGRPLGSFAFVSGFARAAQRALPAWVPVPLPAAYVDGFDAQKLDTERGEFPAYLLGTWRPVGPWYYDLVALGAKTPLPALALFAAGVVALARGALPWRERFAVLAPILALLAALTALNSLKIGVRYLLPALPLLYLAGAALWPRLPGRRATLAAAALVLTQAGSALAAHPDYLAYFNAAAGGDARGHRVLLDSNLDWGQDLYRVPGELARLGYTGTIGLLYFGHVDPALYGISYALVPPYPVAGVLAVSVNFLEGAEYAAFAPDGQRVWIERGHLAWLRGRRPVARCGSIWIFDTRAGASGPPG
jgi:4-amino-4-deoxy-L-arabinose transferase-like glycosyltransferase